MKSRIQITTSSLTRHQPVIQINQSHGENEDARDKLVNVFIEDLGHISCLCTIKPLHTEPSSEIIWEIAPIHPHEIKQSLKKEHPLFLEQVRDAISEILTERGDGIISSNQS